MESLQQEVIRLGDMRVSIEELMKEFREPQLEKQAVYAWCEANRSRMCD